MRSNHVNLDCPLEAELLDRARAHKNLEDEKMGTFLFHLPLSLRKRLKAMAILKDATMNEILNNILSKELDNIS